MGRRGNSNNAGNPNNQTEVRQNRRDRKKNKRHKDNCKDKIKDKNRELNFVRGDLAIANSKAKSYQQMWNTNEINMGNLQTSLDAKTTELQINERRIINLDSSLNYLNNTVIPNLDTLKNTYYTNWQNDEGIIVKRDLSLNYLNNTTIPGLNLTINELYQKVLLNDLSNNIQLLEQEQNANNQIENYLIHNYPIIGSHLIKEKINYREIEHTKLNKINKLLDVIFYIFFFTFITIIIVGGNFKFKERFLIYLIIVLFPFLYPFIFKFMKYLYNNIFVKNYGPKGAFIDLLPSYDAYNI